jgi:hypothetical protein
MIGGELIHLYRQNTSLRTLLNSSILLPQNSIVLSMIWIIQIHLSTHPFLMVEKKRFKKHFLSNITLMQTSYCFSLNLIRIW